jgi:ankyrin repeat protein
MRVNYGGQSNSGGDPNNPITLGDTPRGGSTPLLFAARSDDIEVARLLVAAGANVNDALPDGMSALTLAARSGRTAMAKFLIEQGADPNAYGTGYTPLHVAVLMGDFEVAQALIERGADPNKPMIKAAPVRRGNQELSLPVALLGATPFLLAAKYADLPILRALAAAGGKPDVPMKNGTTPLMAAAGFGSATGGNRRGVGNRYSNYYLAADAESETLEAVTLLVEMGADVNGSDPAGNTPLFGAVAQGYDSVVEFLVSKGARVDARNKRGQTLLALTAAGRDSDGRKSTAELLKRLGAQ